MKSGGEFSSKTKTEPPENVCDRVHAMGEKVILRRFVESEV